MKQYTSKDQTAKLIELGFPKPQYALPIRQEGQALIHALRYSIGELIEFLEANADISIYCVGKYGYWYVDYDLRRVYFDKHLINALYFACKKLKEEGVV